MIRSVANTKIVLNPPRWMAVGFAAITLIGAVLLALPISSSSSASIGFLDALFTSASAVSVTGLAVLDTGTAFTVFGQIIIMLLIQIGGLGFMAFGVMAALALGRKIGLKQRLLIQESTGSTTIQGLVKLTLAIVCISIAFELASTVALTIRWHGDLGLRTALYYAIFHSVSAFNNAGFSLWSDSLSGYAADPAVNLIITASFIAGGIGFTVMIDVYRNKKWRSLSVHSKVVLLTSLSLSLGGAVLIFALESVNPSFRQLAPDEKLWTAYFQGVTPRTAGFNTIDIGGMTAASQFLIVILMFIGASSGSTGGGIKTNTFVILILATAAAVRGRKDVNAFARKIPAETIGRALAVIMISLGIVIFVAFGLSITEHASQRSFLEILFEAASAFGTVGLSMGLTPELTPIGKVLIILTMFIGRIGPLTLAYALARTSAASKISYPEGNILVG